MTNWSGKWSVAPMHEILRLLGLCFRAGKLVSGDDAVADAVGKGTVRLIALSADAGGNITKRAAQYAAEKGIPTIRLQESAQELGWALGRKATAICCITDIGFAAAAAEKAAVVDVQYAELAQQMKQKKQRIASRRGTKKPHAKSGRKRPSGGMKQSTYTKRGGERA
ncbi:MAG: ribosomal L7Ae/L30e/S12e/Gadd45 family protein [Eubacteriales bacterium]|nr:ribosomal L7Ae/L30e/S12e/Gadd45 family protein [Eubacteriales bacterium]